ncbi:hypothetical protein EPUS_00642 [Endocarpon pusillum Z07020]|uniref:Uncharacterized protein n=1 Tax=Endocarpon pusillum (strain Z07020 / HMAS-L-300199) TaxID=1263415 RepID=U1GHT0_ENDPU|nr:uncharacterized protein EPUS_00642 [Endocarpon pusillum Z07020]ERF71653.1 hypothetical protein EPUS_00642 [Endocarpon pusillum Z07020]
MAALLKSASYSLVHDHISRSPHESTTVEPKSCLHALKDSSKAEGLKKARSRLGRLWTWIATDSWTLEYAALTIAVASLASIGILLGIYGERPTSAWTYTITLNSVLSTLATVMKGSTLLPVGACLSQLKWTWYHHEKRSLLHFQLFDAASRGPLGAASLLYQIHSWHLASIGAIVTLIALVSDAFIQQSVLYPSRTINETASVPFSQSYGLVSTYRGRSQGYAYEVEQSMKAAIYNGIFYHNASVTGTGVSANCPTGNCTFPEYASLAMCSRCRGVTSSIKDVCVPVDTTRIGDNVPNNCTMQATLPNGLTMRNIYSEARKNYSTYNNYMNTSTNESLNEKTSTGFWNLVNLTILIANLNTQSSDSSDYDLMYRNPTAFDCGFYFCVQKYWGKVSNGVFSEYILANFTGGETSYHRRKGGGGENWIVNVSKGHLPSASNLTFSVDDESANALLFYLGNLFKGNGSTNCDSGVPSFSSDVMEVIFLKGPSNVPQIMANVATAMTNNLRLKSETVAIGTAIVLETYIHVRWLWLLLPLIMVSLATILLALTVWQSRRWDIPNWRSSALAAMMHGVQEDEEGALNMRALALLGKERISELKRWSEVVQVRLRRRGPSGEDYGLIPADE